MFRFIHCEVKRGRKEGKSQRNRKAATESRFATNNANVYREREVQSLKWCALLMKLTFERNLYLPLTQMIL